MVRQASERFRLGGSARLWIDTGNGPIGATGRVVDLSEQGCHVALSRRVLPGLAGRVAIDVAGEKLWLPIITRTAREDSQTWILECAFDRPTPEKLEQVLELVGRIRAAPPTDEQT